MRDQVNSGGPLETVDSGKTGFLREQTPEAFAEVWQCVTCSVLYVLCGVCVCVCVSCSHDCL